jgi:dimethylaniline monooxygenase (N-oxide forming)
MTVDIQERPAAAPSKATDKRIAIIGAGAAGICCAKYLVEGGFHDVTLFEIGTKIGGMWCFRNDNNRSSAYRTLHINTSRNVTRFSDLDFAPDVQDFPDHRDMHNYLESYADHFDLRRRIRFNSTVTDIRPNFKPGREPPTWVIETADGNSEMFDTVIVATGHLTEPMHVPQFRDGFKGEYLHSHYYREPEPFVGKRICVVGVGNSGCDIVSDICVTSPRTVLVARSGVLILPKLFCGIPFTDITRRIQRPWIPAFLRRKLTGWLTYLVHGRMTNLGFKPMTERAHVTSNATVVTHIAYNRIEVKQGIEKIEGRTIHFVDGTAEEFDTLIAATGYLIDLPFLKPEVVPIVNNEVELYERIVPPAWPGLYFMGMFNTDTALNMVFEHQARWIREMELGTAVLPSESEMRSAIAEHRAWVQRHYRDSPRHTIEEEHVPYIGSLKRTLREARSRRKRP